MTEYSKVFGKDAYIIDTDPDRNHGDSTGWQIAIDYSGGKAGRESRTCAHVDFSDLDILAAEVDTAYAWAYCNGVHSGQNMGVRWHRLERHFIESGPGGVTWNNQPDAALPISDAVRISSLGYKMWTITDMIKDAIDNRDRVWVAIAKFRGYTGGQDNWANFWSREGGPPFEKGPFIVINYTKAAGVKGGSII